MLAGRTIGADEAARSRAERRDRLRTAAQFGTLALQACTLVVTVVVAFAAVKGIQTLEARKERDEARKEESTARREAEAQAKLAAHLREEITELDARRALAEAGLEANRLLALQADATVKEMDAKLQVANQVSQRYGLFAKFYGRVHETCRVTADPRHIASRVGFENCMANILAADPEFQLLSQADAAAMRARAMPPPPTVYLSASPTSVGINGTSMLSWTSTNTSSCSASGAWGGIKQQAGSESTTALSNTATYQVTCTGPGGAASSSQTVTVGNLFAANDEDEGGGGESDMILLALLGALVSRGRPKWT